MKRRSYKILHQNWRCNKGEIDIIALFDKSLVFIEVKTRAAIISEYYSPIEAVDRKKREQLRRLGEIYIAQNEAKLRRLRIRAHRFEQIAVYHLQDSISAKEAFQIRHVPIEG